MLSLWQCVGKINIGKSVSSRQLWRKDSLIRLKGPVDFEHSPVLFFQTIGVELHCYLRKLQRCL